MTQPRLTSAQYRKETALTEHEEQKALIKTCKARQGKYPELALLFAVPNGGHRNKIVAAKLKAEGVKAGVPDLMLPVPRGQYHGLFIEMKRVEGSTTQKSQKAMIEALQKQGYMAEICKGADAAWRVIERYLKMKKVGL